MGDVRRAVQNVSPDDRIMWDCNKDIPSSASSIGGIRRAKKRARSSSPASSPAHALSRFQAKEDSLINQQIDPGCELWGRYSLTTSNNPTPQGTTISSLAHIMHTSSPQALKDGRTPRLGTGFRRANSCGTTLPKRRRVGGYNGETSDIFSEFADIGPSKLSVLIEKVQQGLTRPDQPDSESRRSSSPSVQAGTLSARSEGSSPIRRKANTERLTTSNFDITALPERNSADFPRLPEASDEHDGSSDYGEFDDDFGDDILDAAGPRTTDSSNVDIAPPKAHEDPPRKSWVRPLSASAFSPTKPEDQSKASNALDGEDDEFGEMDDDLLATAEFEHIMSQYEARAVPEMKNSEGKSHMSIDAGSETQSEDDFGDDFDDVDLAAVEAAATQSAAQATSGILSVRAPYA